MFIFSRRCRANLLRRVFALAVAGCAVTVHAAGALVIGTLPGTTPPLDMAWSAGHCVAGPGTPHGISVDAVERIAATLGVTPEWRLFCHRAEMIAALERGDIDMVTAATGAVADDALLLSHPYLPIHYLIVRPLAASRAPTNRLAYVESQIDPSALQSAYPSLAPMAFNDLVGALLAVSLGDADAFVGDMTATAYTISHFDLPNLTVTGVAPLADDGYRFAFASTRPASAALRRRVDDALAALPPSFALVEQRRWSPSATNITRDEPIALTPDEQAWMRAHPVVPYSMLSQGAPVMFVDSRGQPAGYVVDVLAAIARVTGLRFEPHVRASSAQMQGDLRNGVSMIVPVNGGTLSSRADGEPTVPTGDGILAIVTASGAPRLRDAAALAGKRIALPDYSPLRNTVRDAAPTARIVDTHGFDGLLRAVAQGDADATVIEMSFANYVVGNPYRGALVTSGVLSTVPVPRGFVVAPDQPVLLGIMNRAIEALPPAEFEAIHGRWKLAEHPETVWERRRPQVELGALLGGALLLALAGWALTLRVQIARRVAAERAMRAAKEEAETANRAKSTFLATMSHEIRTPMNAVLGLLELELRAPGERAATERALTTAHRAALDLLGMIDDLLDVAKIEAERLVLTPAPLEMRSWIASVAAIYEPAARAKRIALIVRQPDADVPVWLLADAQRLRQVVGNLLSNAIKFTDSGAVTLRCEIGASEEGRRVLTLEVSDTGVGIPPERQALLFTPFTQAHDGGARSFGGTGLGLTISKRLVAMMGGDIGFVSTPGAGTRFTVRVCLPDASAPEAHVAHTPTAEPDRRAPLAGLRVLIVDDHPANRIVLDGQIRILGGTPMLASDGRAALRTWRDGRAEIDFIITDCSMPEMSGEQLASAIRADEAALPMHVPARVPIIGLTANAQPDAAARALSAGMTACLVKPISLDALRDALLADAVTQRPDLDKTNTPIPAETPAAPFDEALLAAFGEQRGALVETLKAANADDLAQAQAAFTARDRARLGELAHRMKGAAAVIGATPFVASCVALQHACEQARALPDDDANLTSAFDSFRTAATALERALDAAIAHNTA